MQEKKTLWTYLKLKQRFSSDTSSSPKLNSNNFSYISDPAIPGKIAINKNERKYIKFNENNLSFLLKPTDNNKQLSKTLYSLTSPSYV